MGEVKIRINIAHQNIEDKEQEQQEALNKIIKQGAYKIKETRELIGPNMMVTDKNMPPIGRYTENY